MPGAERKVFGLGRPLNQLGALGRTTPRPFAIPQRPFAVSPRRFAVSPRPFVIPQRWEGLLGIVLPLHSVGKGCMEKQPDFGSL